MLSRVGVNLVTLIICGARILDLQLSFVTHVKETSIMCEYESQS